ncbi:hypothetical protein Murru_2554 [Allomuricauda ruestringensis DSM 13258]|uniref:Uncharacterized protein n=1 Tax=Allomuricauda ruestringensis (strain DSM 13258 / CIP 107369 / LMG 19739 / B1) TaxID=886377 RepID=G2PQ84_ALLRU|nr:hypothetical protein [Allomuricauda ruestringensis]AEM71590.1 hypothetical protein Murru_2554 [Allomuricauda ruestringensis DSM 13258]
MANHCYNTITITGTDAELETLHTLLTKEKDHIDFEHVLKREIPFKDIYKVVGTKWFTPDIDFRDGELKLYGDSAWSPPVPFFETLVGTYPSLKVAMRFEEPGMGFGGELEINSDGTNIIFGGTYWQYMVYLDYESFYQNAISELQSCLEDGYISTETQLMEQDIFRWVYKEDRPKLLKKLWELTGLKLYTVTFEENPHIEERVFATSIDDLKQKSPKAVIKEDN